MILNVVQSPHRARRKCANCQLVNSGTDDVCRRCGTVLPDQLITEVAAAAPESLDSEKPRHRSFLKRVLWVLGATTTLLIVWYVSLLVSADGLQPDQSVQVENAIEILQQQGFSREVFVLKRLAAFRITDNWFNAYFGHRDAYAATNFPFEVVTLYPDFFELPIDDRERAAVLLHEARHLLGDNEDDALIFTWKNKKQLGWTADKYSQSKVWDATERWTRDRYPYMFQCGADNRRDCY
jgi:hypothetical protein